MLDKINGDETLKDDYEIYFTITKFDNDYGFSLIHQEQEGVVEEEEREVVPEHTSNLDIENKNPNSVYLESPSKKEEELKWQRKAQLNKHGVIPEFIKISEIYQLYTAFTQANLKNSILHQK